jgi:hypothetical protein
MGTSNVAYITIGLVLAAARKEEKKILEHQRLLIKLINLMAELPDLRAQLPVLRFVPTAAQAQHHLFIERARV